MQDEQRQRLESFVGKPLYELVQGLGLDYTKASFYDEPPGKLRVISFTTSEMAIRVSLRYEAAALYSTTRVWPFERTRSAIVIGISSKASGLHAIRVGETPVEP